MTKNKINKILIVGYGNIALRHYRIINSLLPNAKIKFLRSNPKKILNKKNQIASFVEVKKFLPDLAVLANPSSKHIEISFKLLKIKIKYFFIEKPISNKFLNAKKFLKHCQKNNINVFVGYNLKYCKSLTKIKTLIDNKYINNIFLVTVETGFN